MVAYITDLTEKWSRNFYFSNILRRNLRLIKISAINSRLVVILLMIMSFHSSAKCMKRIVLNSRVQFALNDASHQIDLHYIPTGIKMIYQ